MKIDLRWQPPEDVWAQQFKEGRRRLFRFAFRMSGWVWVAGFGFWYAAVYWFPAPLPAAWFTAVPWIIGAMGGVWWLPWPTTLRFHKARRYRITRFGIDDLPWRQIKAFGVEPLADFPEAQKLVLYVGRGRTKTRTLPADPRRKDAVLALVTRKVAPLETLKDHDDVRHKPPALPRWYTPTCLATAAGWAIGVAWLIDAYYGPQKISGETAQLLVMLSAIVQPATWLSLGLWQVPRFRRTGDARFGVWAVCSMIVWIGGMMALAIIRF